MQVNKSLTTKAKRSNVIGYDSKFEKSRGTSCSKLYSFEQDLISLISETMNVLDIGTGQGVFINKIVSSRIGLDISLKNLKIIKNSDNTTNLYLIQADAENIPIRSSRIDLILLTSVLHHLPNYLSALIENIRILKNNGMLYLSEPNRIGVPFIRLIEYLAKIRGHFAEFYNGLDIPKIFLLFKKNDICYHRKTKSSIRFTGSYFILWYYNLIMQNLAIFFSNRFRKENSTLRKVFVFFDRSIGKILPSFFNTWIQGLFIKKHPEKLFESAQSSDILKM